MAAQAQAAQILDFLHTDLTLLTPRDKAGVLGLLRKTLLATEEHFLATTNRGITIFRDVSDLPRNRIYRVSGMGEVQADAGVRFAAATPAASSAGGAGMASSHLCSCITRQTASMHQAGHRIVLYNLA